jgi:hypothetical protein
MLLCYLHHTEVDGNEHEYKVELLRQWKSDRESRRQQKLPSNMWLTQDSLQELITNVFADRNKQIQETLERLEASDREAADMMRTLTDEITELRMRGSLIDADVVGTLDSAANRLGHLQDTASWLLDSAQRLGHLQDTAGLLEDSARTLGSTLDTKINMLEALIDELRGLQRGF